MPSMPDHSDLDQQRRDDRDASIAPTLELRVVRLDPSVPLPAYAHEGDAGMDLAAAAEVTLAPMGRAAVPTGLAVAIPAGWVGLVHPRSGLARRHGVTVANAPGTIDSGYRGELQVLLINLGADAVTLDRGDRIAQLLLQPVGRATVVEASHLDDTTRGDGGFGSTGLHGVTEAGGDAAPA
jgi:dUTP pyrophosphatase